MPIIVTEAMNSANSGIQKLSISARLMFLLLLASALPFSLSAQSVPGEDLRVAEVFTPFVSGLQTEVLESSIRLTWTDIPDVEGVSYNIYRSNVEITRRSFSTAELRATIPAGVETYTDSIPQNGPYFYAVLTVDPDGSELPLFIPFRNTNVLAAVMADLPENFAAAGINALTARAGEQDIFISFSVQGDLGDIALFRSTSPITDSSSLADAIRLETLQPGVVTYRDFVIPGIPYYYAALSLADIGRSRPQLITGQNTLDTPAELPLGRRFAGVSTGPRGQSLPLLILDQSVISGGQLPRSGVEIPDRRRMSPQTAGQVARLLEPIQIAREAERLPDILATERNPAGEKDQSLVLYTIVSESFSLENYDLAVRQLESLLTIPLSADLENRARYYYAQSLYFSAEYERAFLQFLIIQNWDYRRVTPWMDAILAELARIRRA